MFTWNFDEVLNLSQNFFLVCPTALKVKTYPSSVWSAMLIDIEGAPACEQKSHFKLKCGSEAKSDLPHVNAA